MEGVKQAEVILTTWTQAQEKMWNGWFIAMQMQGFGNSQPTEVWEKTVETWEDSVKKTLDAQVEWTRLWAESFSTVSGMPNEMVEWARKGQEMTKHWAEVQGQLWENWFEIVKKLDSTMRAGTWEREGQKLTKVWQENVQKVMESQAEWFGLWTTGQAGEQPKEQKEAKM